MAQNISKYVQLNDFLLLEYEFNRDGEELNLQLADVNPYLAITSLGEKQYFNHPLGLGWTNNTLALQSIPINSKRFNWYVNPDDVSSYFSYFDSSTIITQDKYPHDTVKVHIVSGYNFDDIAGFLLQIRALDTSDNLVDISNFTWIKQIQGNSVIKFSIEPLYLGNRFYDKYVELRIPSIGTLGGRSTEPIESALSIKSLSDIYIQYSTITEINSNNQYLISEKIQLQLPVISNADNFNCFIAESTSGDYIEYYATWNDTIIGEYMGDIESGRIPLFTSNNPNDNYSQFTEQYGEGSSKWVIIHEIQVFEHIPPTTTLLTQKFQFTQEDNFMTPNKFRPVLVNADIASSYSIDYICRLMNRMDGSQIIRKASFASTNPKKYGKILTRINVDNYIPYKVYNKIQGEKANIIVNPTQNQISKFVKVFYDTTNVLLDYNNVVLPQGTGPLFLKIGDGIYKFKFKRLNDITQQTENVDLSGVYNYALLFVLDDNTKIEISPTYSTNMNTVLGELEFKIMNEQANLLLKQTNNVFSIIIKNTDGTEYTFYQGLYYNYTDIDLVFTKYNQIFSVNTLNDKIANLEYQVKILTEENMALKSK